MKTRKTTRTKASGQREFKPAAKGACPIVAIGASAGGLEATTEFLTHLPANPGMAFVVMQHLDPTHESALRSLLARATNMRVHEAKNDMPLVANNVYVIPPNRVMRLARRKLKVKPRRSEREVHMPIDFFLESLASEEGDEAIGVILSGNGSDGTRGLLAIKATGGLTFAQDEKSAKYTAMPANAVAAGCVDFVLSPAEIAKELTSLAGRPLGEPLPILPSTSKAQAEERAFEEIIALLRQQAGVDFAHYKRPTLERRIRRRMVLQKLGSLRAYSDYLRRHVAEVQALTTLNDELETRNSELESVNNDLHNLLASVNIPVVMIGPDLRIRRFTGVSEKLLNLIPTDVGRPITDIKMKIDLPNLSRLISEVIDTLQTKELEMRGEDGHWWSVRIRPYKTTDHKIDGAVVVFVNVDAQKNPPGAPAEAA